MTHRLTDTELEAIRERLAAATPGPWEARAKDYRFTLVPLFTKEGRLTFTYGYGWGDDADFIAHAPTDVAALLAEVERLRAVEQNLSDIIAGATVEYAMAYRWPNGNVVPFGSASYYRAGVQQEVDEANRNEQGSPALLARRLVTRWTPAEDGAP